MSETQVDVPRAAASTAAWFSNRALDRRSACVWACLDCLRACNACAQAFAAVPQVSPLGRARWLNSNCADLCSATGRMLAGAVERDVRLIRAVLQACGSACRMARMECEVHAKGHQQFRIVARACRRCELACDRLSQIL